MKITENEVEVAEHRSVIAPLLLFFLFMAGGRALFFSAIGAPRACLAQEDMGLKLTGCCFSLQKTTLSPCSSKKKHKGADDREKINK